MGMGCRYQAIPDLVNNLPTIFGSLPFFCPVSGLGVSSCLAVLWQCPVSTIWCKESALKILLETTDDPKIKSDICLLKYNCIGVYDLRGQAKEKRRNQVALASTFAGFKMESIPILIFV